MSGPRCESAAEEAKDRAHQSTDWLETQFWLDRAKDFIGLAELYRHLEALDRWEGEGGAC